MIGGDTPTFYTYLHINGGAYIITDIIPPQDSSFRVRVRENQRIAMQYFGCSGQNSSKFGVELNNNTNGTNRYFSAHYGSNSAVVSGTTKQVSWGGVPSYQLWLTCKRLGTGSTSVVFSKGQENPTSGLVIGNNGSLDGTPYIGNIRHFYVYGDETQNVTNANGFNSYTPIIILTPCVFRGEAGLWHNETGRFYGNSAGVGTLTADDVDN